MIIFDVDGTLIGGEPTDWAYFGNAFETVAGFPLTTEFYAKISEVTAQAIVHQALNTLPLEERKAMEHSVREHFLQNLIEAHSADRGCIPPAEGAVDLLCTLEDSCENFAIATGDWEETVSFKLNAANIPFDGIPMTTSSEFFHRADIISATIQKSGGALHETIYVGDGLWDLNACNKLGIKFIGVGSRRERLAEAGAAHTLPDLSPPGFLSLVKSIRENVRCL